LKNDLPEFAREDEFVGPRAGVQRHGPWGEDRVAAVLPDQTYAFDLEAQQKVVLARSGELAAAAHDVLRVGVDD